MKQQREKTIAERMASVSVRAVIQRINRKLVKEQEQLRTARGQRQQLDLGVYYILDVNRNFIVAHHCDPETLGRELGVVAAWESVTDD